ncbi:nucleotidyltransferase family protein [Actinosynnema sp. CS-041913]|uniref:nucleotidyltransferase family protein n=1 Tax=Actinosynnema sp. CS-041913 TaxID=3239917 RepID=UPI003D8CE29E
MASIHDDRAAAGEVDFDIILAEVDWDFLMAAAVRHRMLPRLADLLIRSDLSALVPTEYRRALVMSLHENRHRCAEASTEANRVVKALVAAGVRVACTKGVGFQVTLYGGLGGRYFDDVDVMIHPEDQARVTAVMRELGYLENMEHDLCTDTLVALSRQDVAMFRLYPDHLPHFVRPAVGCAFPYHTVDVCFDITWYGAAWRIPMREVLAEVRQVAVPVGGEEVVTLPVLTAPYDFIFTATHLFREGWFARTIALKNLRLGQFADLWRLWHRLEPTEAAELVRLIDGHGIAPPIAWACHHVDRIFGGDLVAGLGLGDFCDEDWLHSAGAVDGTSLSWTGDMRERIRSSSPIELSPAPAPRFAVDARAARR